MPPEERRLFRILMEHFWKSLKPINWTGTLIGKDKAGNKYFEIPSDLSQNRVRPRRWFEPVVEENFQQKLQPEWQTWLRYGRIDPPTDEEIELNEMLKKKTLENAEKLRIQRGETKEIRVDSARSFPKYDDMERKPGELNTKDVWEQK